ncbi:hypothetical protein BOTBODRAFT_29004 [Botryobasidium botryosum FD-172 SS1]|uniref:Small ribosomal subunit protein mS33 n=1 Tax=Botryobasidium botryosum (strain FD-172 SS1) TaxID=930990 RepID=A0A067MSM9_BOTB1|nr:hypothetical protein BOTBODRAFT_29004 [Botryobasidium botryosum FD-172 SS1]
MAAAMVPTRTRLQSLLQLRSSIFATSYNPRSLRTGAKYLRARLRGPSMTQYYPEQLSISRINAVFKKMDIQLIDYEEQQRLEDVENRKKRGKGAPKKAKTKEDSRRAAKKKRK